MMYPKKTKYSLVENMAHDLVDRLAYVDDDKEKYDIIVNYLLEKIEIEDKFEEYHD